MWIVPVDLASVSDFTAVAAVQVAGRPDRRYAVRHLDRWREPYPETVRRVADLANRPPLTSAVLVVDATGVGRPVVDMLRAALPGRRVFGVTITAGSAVTPGQTPLDVRVPKKDLIGAAQVLLTTGRLAVARELPLRAVLEDELANYRVKITPAMNETYEAWREGMHDDLVLALAMAAWLGENLPGDLPPADQLVLNHLPGDDPEPDRPRSRLEMIAADLPHLFDPNGG